MNVYKNMDTSQQYKPEKAWEGLRKEDFFFLAGHIPSFFIGISLEMKSHFFCLQTI